MIEDALLKNICNTIARRTPYPAIEIENAYKICKSLDMVLVALEINTANGRGLPLDALVRMTSTRETYKQYMKHRFALEHDS